MQKITWSPSLHDMVKKVKCGGVNHSEDLLSNKDFIKSYSLSDLEEKGIKKSLGKYKNNDVVFIWF